MNTYVYVDVSRKQEYIFTSNKLKDNIARSCIVRLLTEYDNDFKFKNSVTLKNYLEKHSGVGHYCGGGNSIVKFNTEEKASRFIRDYSKSVLKSYPEIELYMSKLSLKKNESFSVSEKHKLEVEATILKEKRRSKFEKLTFGIEEIDKETGYPVLSESTLNNQYESIVKEAKKQLIDELEYENVTFEMSNYKGNGFSYVGVITLDGNRMGEFFKDITEIETLKEKSQSIKKIYLEAIKSSLKKLNNSNNDFRKYVTPIVSAGDDMCLIVDARIAIEFAVNILKNIKEKSEEIIGKTITACAGVAIVKAGYPFFEAYNEAEEMCKNSKLHCNKSNKTNISAIDWKIVQGSNIEYHNFRESVKENEKYHIKPLQLEKTDEENVCYETYRDLTMFIKDKMKENRISSSTLKKLQESFYEGYMNYELNIKERRDEYTKELFSETKKLFKCNDYGVIEDKDIKIYALNDIIDSLKFINMLTDTTENQGGEIDG